MSKGKNKNSDIKRRGQFIPWFLETTDTPAWKAMSMGARVLYMALKRHHFVGFNNNNGRIFLSERDAAEEMGVASRNSIRRWFRELQHFGFIVMTSPGSLGVDGKGKAPNWRLTELETPLADSKEPTLDYLKWDGRPFNGNQAWRGRGPKPKKQNPGYKTIPRVDTKQRPLLDTKQRPPTVRSGYKTTSISDPHPGYKTTSISRLTTGGLACLPDHATVEAKLPWNTPTVVEVTDPERDPIAWSSAGRPNLADNVTITQFAQARTAGGFDMRIVLADRLELCGYVEAFVDRLVGCALRNQTRNEEPGGGD